MDAVAYDTDRSEDLVAALSAGLRAEVEFTIELMHRFAPDLAIYYTHALDSVAHRAWSFYLDGGYFVGRSPDQLSDEEWDRFVLENAEAPVFRIYSVIDELVGRVVPNFPMPRW